MREGQTGQEESGRAKGPMALFAISVLTLSLSSHDSLRCSPCPGPSELQGATCPHLPGLTLFSPCQAQEDVRQQLREFEETKKQIEEDEDREIQDIKTKYEKKLRDEKEANLRLKGETGIMRKKVPGWFLRGMRGNPGPTAEKAWGGWTDTESANSGSAQGRDRWGGGGRLAEFPPEMSSAPASEFGKQRQPV